MLQISTEQLLDGTHKEIGMPVLSCSDLVQFRRVKPQSRTLEVAPAKLMNPVILIESDMKLTSSMF